MPVLFRREVPLRTIVAIEPDQARALQAPVRLAMLDLLSRNAMSIEELYEELPAHGFRKATNTLRHHLEILVKAGLVELAILEQTRGAVLKYFQASARPLHYHLPEASDAEMSILAERLKGPIAAAIGNLSRSERERIVRLAGTLNRCPRCTSDHYEEFVLLAAVHRACVAYLRQKHASANPRVPSSRTRRGSERSVGS